MLGFRLISVLAVTAVTLASPLAAPGAYATSNDAASAARGSSGQIAAQSTAEPATDEQTTIGQTPSATVERLNDTLIETMKKAKDLGYKGRYDNLAPVLEEVFNFPLMARVAVSSKNWNALDEDQRRRLVDTFTKLSIATYAARFDGFSGERFEITGQKQGNQKTILVRNRLVKSDGETVPLDYLLRKVDGEWRVVDIYLDAKYSELALKRSEYTSVMKRQGFEDLLDIMKKKISAFEPSS